MSYVSLVTAVAVATVFGFFSLPYRNYHCWWSWTRAGAITFTGIFLLLSGGGGGLLGWGAATLSKASPTGSPAMNGILYGLAGALALRADLRAGPAGQGESEHSHLTNGPLSGSRSALGLALTWTTTGLYDKTRHSAESWYRARSNDELIGESQRLKAYLLEAGVSEEFKIEFLKRLTEAVTKLRSTDSSKQREGRILLSTFAASYCAGEYVPKVGN